MSLSGWPKSKSAHFSPTKKRLSGRNVHVLIGQSQDRGCCGRTPPSICRKKERKTTAQNECKKASNGHHGVSSKKKTKRADVSTLLFSSLLFSSLLFSLSLFSLSALSSLSLLSLSSNSHISPLCFPFVVLSLSRLCRLFPTCTDTQTQTEIKADRRCCANPKQKVLVYNLLIWAFLNS